MHFTGQRGLEHRHNLSRFSSSNFVAVFPFSLTTAHQISELPSCALRMFELHRQGIDVAFRSQFPFALCRVQLASPVCIQLLFQLQLSAFPRAAQRLLVLLHPDCKLLSTRESVRQFPLQSIHQFSLALQFALHVLLQEFSLCFFVCSNLGQFALEIALELLLTGFGLGLFFSPRSRRGLFRFDALLSHPSCFCGTKFGLFLSSCLERSPSTRLSLADLKLSLMRRQHGLPLCFLLSSRLTRCKLALENGISHFRLCLLLCLLHRSQQQRFALLF